MEPGELSVRVNQVGPPLASGVRLKGESPDGKASIVVLIHGYNNSYDEARSAYKVFLHSLQEVAGFPIAIPVYEFFWPGDETWKVYSALSFAGKIGVAVSAADIFCNYLATLRGSGGGPLEIHFVAHSLGNRLLLALLKSSARFPTVVVRSVTLMAAAVPVGMVESGKALYAASQVPSFSQVLCSRGDDVLHWAFPAGETAGGEGFFPEAVGRFGKPSGNWRSSYSFDSFGHGDYWKRPGPPALVLARLGIAAPRQTASSATATRSTATRKVGS